MNVGASVRAGVFHIHTDLRVSAHCVCGCVRACEHVCEVMHLDMYAMCDLT